MEIKAGVFDRIGQSFVLFKNNFVGLFLPLFLYHFISVVIVGTISKYYMMNSFAGIDNMDGLDLFSFLNNSSVVIVIVISTMLFIAYLLLYVVVLLGFLKSLKQALNSEKITIINNINYGLNSFTSSMKTYWYIFSYVALIPAILFIAGGILLNLSYYIGDLDYLILIGGALIILSIVLFIIFAVYRGIKSTFALYSAVNENDFSKQNFILSVKNTDNNWWRILGNFLLVGILISVISSILLGILGLVSFFSNGGFSFMDSIMSSMFNGGQMGNPNMGEIKIIIDDYITNFSLFGEIISNTINNLINTIFAVFLLIFTYLFFLRLKQESIKDIKISDNKQTIEL